MYSFSTRLTGNLDEIEQKLIGALKDEGFGILTEIDVQATAEEKTGSGEEALQDSWCLQPAPCQPGH